MGGGGIPIPGGHFGPIVTAHEELAGVFGGAFFMGLLGVPCDLGGGFVGGPWSRVVLTTGGGACDSGGDADASPPVGVDGAHIGDAAGSMMLSSYSSVVHL